MEAPALCSVSRAAMICTQENALRAKGPTSAYFYEHGSSNGGDDCEDVLGDAAVCNPYYAQMLPDDSSSSSMSSIDGQLDLFEKSDRPRQMRGINGMTMVSESASCSSGRSSRVPVAKNNTSHAILAGNNHASLLACGRIDLVGAEKRARGQAEQLRQKRSPENLIMSHEEKRPRVDIKLHALHPEKEGEDCPVLRQDLAAEPKPAGFDVFETPWSFVDAAIEEAATRGKKPIKIRENVEQMEFLALLASKVRELLDAGYEAGTRQGENPDMGTEVPPVKPMRVFFGGPRDAEKLECIDIAGRMLEHFFGKGSKQVLAASNAVARGVGGQTVHRGLDLSGFCSFRLATKAMKKPISCVCEEAWAPVKVLFLEEVFMISPDMLAGISYRLCRARQAGRRWLDARLYEHEQHMFGGIPIVVMLGDFAQLGAMEKRFGRASLIMQPKPSWHYECHAGWCIFWHGMTHAVMWRKTHCFRDDVMPPFLEFIRNCGDGSMPSDLQVFPRRWKARCQATFRVCFDAGR